MLLDKGVCTVYAVKNIAASGDMPQNGLEMKYQSWYGELSFETAPINVSDAQEDVEVSARIRIHQNRAISNLDVAVLSEIAPPPDGATRYTITRAYHGFDKAGHPMTDLTLKEVSQTYDAPRF